MSRIILSKYDNGEDHVVVGYDRPLQTYYWQEFNKEPEGDDESKWDGWESILGSAGNDWKELPTPLELMDSASTNNTVMTAILLAVNKSRQKGGLIPELERHKTLDYPDSNIIIDLSGKE